MAALYGPAAVRIALVARADPRLDADVVPDLSGASTGR